jgi:hypothetical protein
MVTICCVILILIYIIYHVVYVFCCDALTLYVCLSVCACFALDTTPGLDYVGTASIFICVFSMLPFVVFCVLGAGQVQPERWSVQPPEGWRGINWRLYLNTFFWNFNYWDSAASYSGDVCPESCQNIPPRSLQWLCVGVSVDLSAGVDWSGGQQPALHRVDGRILYGAGGGGGGAVAGAVDAGCGDGDEYWQL